MSIKKALLCFMTIILIVAFDITSFASENYAVNNEITATTAFNGGTFRCTYPYNDHFFIGPDDEFRQELARASIGLCLASARDLSGVENEGDRIDKYLCDAGYEDVDTSSYLSPTETDSIACGLGHKKIGDSTLIALGICSANYGKEWAGNLRVGDETDHVGFRIAADKLKEYLKNYEELHGISGKKMLWITGFSRGGAVGNLLSGDLMRDTEYEKLFGYFFATPRNTKEPQPYANIFNIIVKDDYVPMVPLAEWGYERNGIDMYTFSPASDTDIGAEIDALDVSSMELAGVYYYNNQSVNFVFRTIANYMCDIFETSAEYTDNLQELIIRTFDEGISDDFFSNMSKALSQLTFENPKKEHALQGFKAYLNYFVNDYVYRGYPEENGHVGWNSDESFFANINREHTIPRYSIWMMADITPERLFSTNMTFTKVVISTDADLEVYDEYGLLETFDKKLTYHVIPERSVRNQSYVDIFRNGKQLLVSVPYGRELRLVLKAKHPEVVQLFTYDCSYEHIRYSNEYMGMINLDSSPCTLIFGPEYGDGFTVKNGRGSQIVRVGRDNMLSTDDLVALENDGVDTISLFDLGIILGSFLLLVLLGIIISIILAVIRKRKGAKKTARSMIIAHGIFTAICTIYCLLTWKYYPGIYILSTGFACLTCVGISLMALRGYLMNKNKRALITFIASVPLTVLVTLCTTIYIPFSVLLAVIIVAAVTAAFTAVCFLCFKNR